MPYIFRNVRIHVLNLEDACDQLTTGLACYISICSWVCLRWDSLSVLSSGSVVNCLPVNASFKRPAAASAVAHFYLSFMSRYPEVRPFFILWLVDSV